MTVYAPQHNALRGFRRRTTVSAAALLCAVSLWAGPAASQQIQEVQQELEGLKGALEQERAEHEHLSAEADKLLAEERELRDQAIASARRAQELEDRLIQLEVDLLNLTTREEAARQSLESKAGQHVEILMALQRLAATPPEIIIALPRGPRDQLRTATILKAALPAVDQHARMLQEELRAIRRLRSDIANTRRETADATTNLANEQAEMERLLAAKRALREETEAAEAEAARDLANLVAKAETLTDLLAALEKQPRLNLPVPRAKPAYEPSVTEIEIADEDPVDPAFEPAQAIETASLATPSLLMGTTRSFAETKGKIPYPARGSVVVNFGDRVETGGKVQGVRSQGIEIATRKAAQVVAPFEGRVVYAGPFRQYRLLLIIEHDDGYHSLVAGLDRLDAVMGHYLLTGEPIGIMGDEDPKLYLEMRQNGQPFDPLPWLASRKDKVSG